MSFCAKPHPILVFCCLAIACLLPSAVSAQSWVTAPGLGRTTQTVLHFRRDFDLKAVPKTFDVDVSADNRFILYLNGKRIGQGPARGDLRHWRYETFGLTPYLKAGHNVLAAEVWNAKGDPAVTGFSGAPMAQISAQTGFWLRGHDDSTIVDSGDHWRVAIQPGHSFASPVDAIARGLHNGVWYVASGAETIDGRQVDWDWDGAKETVANWADAVAVAATPWALMADPLPAMTHDPVAPGKAVRASTPDLTAFPAKSVTVPAHSEATLLVDQGVMISAYPELILSGGKDAVVTTTYAEALYDAQGHKGDRSAVGDRRAVGPSDTFTADGGAHRAFRPLWWRTWRYMDITIKTGDQPLTLDGLSLRIDAYPLTEKGYFHSSDAQLNAIWDIGWRTVRLDAHETFMDSAYWEQLQYVGDTRLDNLVVYGVSGDPRLPEQAIDAFGEGTRADGMIQSAYPSYSDNVIPTFGLLWIGMMHDYWMNVPDQAVITRNLPGARKILDWYVPYVAPNGLLKRNPDWNFVDWVGDPALDREVFPSFDKASGTSCLTSLFYLGALKQAADLETADGDAGHAADDRTKASALTHAIQDNCWDAARGLYADDPSKTIFSQHANALAVLYDVAPSDQAKAILDKIIKPAGIDAPDGILTTSYYFSWYLIHACDHAGLGDRYLTQLQTWRDLLGLHFTTWPEQRGDTRSDSHAWSSHPTLDLIGIVAGVTSDAPGYAAVRIEPHPGNLASFDAGSATPKGLVTVSYRSAGGKMSAVVTLPEGLPGRFVWHGRSQPLIAGANTVVLTP